MITRRTTLIGGAVLAGAPAFGQSVARRKKRATAFVLVHGTGFGGWCWRTVSQHLIDQGYQVFSPTLTGLGERSHLISPNIGLETHIEDVVNTVISEELTSIIIVGHSYAGAVITGVCDRLRDRIEHAVYIDAAAVKNGSSNASGRTLAQLSETIGPFAEGYLLVPRDAGIVNMGVLPSDQRNFDWLKRRLTPHPIKTWVDPIVLKNGGSDGLPRTFIFCNQAPALSSIRLYADQIRNDPTWSFRELVSGHAAMITHPDETAKLLLQIASR